MIKARLPRQRTVPVTMSNPERIRTAATFFKSPAARQHRHLRTGSRTDRTGAWNLFNGSRHYTEQHASGVHLVTVTATGWRSTPRSK